MFSAFSDEDEVLKWMLAENLDYFEWRSAQRGSPLYLRCSKRLLRWRLFSFQRLFSAPFWVSYWCRMTLRLVHSWV